MVEAQQSGLMSDTRKAAKRLAYQGSQMTRIAWYTGHYMAGRRKMGALTEPGAAPYADVSSALDRKRLRDSYRALFEQDRRNIENGIYKMPRDLRRIPSLQKALHTSKDYLRDAARVAQRKRDRQHSEVLTEKAREKFPRYFLQNFHFQSDGWLSHASAERYDMQVETLFTGAAAAMRRQALLPIAAFLKASARANARFVDLACGNGGFLEEVAENWPGLTTTGVDLSPAYLSKARARLGRFPLVELKQADAAKTGLPSQSVDVASCIFLFHELPPAVRKDVAREIFRILKPGGIFVLVDTLQYGDEAGLDILLENFPRGFHEPYYDSFCRADLASLFGDVGLKQCDETLAFLSKVSVFKKAGD